MIQGVEISDVPAPLPLDGTFRRTGGIQRQRSGDVADLDDWAPLVWGLPGQGEPGDGCGSWVPRFVSPGCTKIWRIQKSCFQSKCPRCYIKWASREAGIAAARILDHPTGGYASQQAIVSPAPSWTPTQEEYDREKQWMIKNLKVEGWTGFCTVYHPFRARCSTCSRRLESCEDCRHCGEESKKVYDVAGGHWHIVGWKKWSPAKCRVCQRSIDQDELLSWNMRERFALECGHASGVRTAGEWGSRIYKCLRLRNGINIFKRLKDTIAYELSHAGLRPRRHAITWCGELSYNKIPQDPLPETVPPDCPDCGEQLSLLDFHAVLDRHGNIDWVEVATLYGGDPRDWRTGWLDPPDPSERKKRCHDCGDELLFDGPTCRSCRTQDEERRQLYDQVRRYRDPSPRSPAE